MHTEISQQSPGPSEALLSRGLAQAISNAAVSVLYHDAKSNVLWSLNTPAPWNRSPFGDEVDGQDLADEGAKALVAARRHVLENGSGRTLELRIPDLRGSRWFLVWIDPDRGQTGNVVGVVTTAIETTEQKTREQSLSLLLRELSHRSKNLLAIILSIASQTGRHSETIETFLTRFRGRIQSLAASQDLITSSNWRGADLHQLATSQIARYCADPVRNIRFTGPNPYLNPNAGMYIGLALHELAANSHGYGALAQEDGGVVIGVEITKAGERPGLEVIWSESVAPADRRQIEKRFGSVALERVVPAALDGSATFTIDSDQIEYRLFVPLGNYEIL